MTAPASAPSTDHAQDAWRAGVSVALFTLALVIAVASAMLRRGLATLPLTLPLMLTAAALLRASTPHAARFRLVVRGIYAVVGGSALLVGGIVSVWPG